MRGTEFEAGSSWVNAGMNVGSRARLNNRGPGSFGEEKNIKKIKNRRFFCFHCAGARAPAAVAGDRAMREERGRRGGSDAEGGRAVVGCGGWSVARLLVGLAAGWVGPHVFEAANKLNAKAIRHVK